MGAEPLHAYATPLLSGVLIRRCDRFLAEVLLDSGEEILAHCVNTGRMEGLTARGLRVWVSHNPNPTRKLQYSWEITQVGAELIGTNTAMPNRLAAKLIEGRMVRGLDRWTEMKAEQRYGENSRVDFLLNEGKRLHYVEVKNCHLVYPDGRGYFPDSVSERATKHLEELIEVMREGHRATVLFVAQHPAARAMRPSDAHDPAFAEAARRAKAAGVRFRAVRIIPTPEGLFFGGVIPVDLRPYRTERMKRWREEGRAAGPAWYRRNSKLGIGNGE
ncbi:DNA/RNA nuclease SfsA [soil metagenome]